MHLYLSLPEHLAEHPAFAAGPFAARVAGSDADVVAVAGVAPSTADGDDDDDSSAAGAVVQILILLLIPLGMYFLLIRPQRRRAREQQALQRSIGVGDEVLTTSGIYGFVTAIEEGSDVVWVEIDDDVQVRLTRAAISGKVNTTASTPPADADETELALGDADEPGPPPPPAAPTAPTGTTPTTRGKAGGSRPSLKGRGASASSNAAETAEPGNE